MIMQNRTTEDPQYPHIPIEMFRLFPNDQKLFFTGEGKTIRRFLFQGLSFSESLTKFEKQKYDGFMEYIEKNKKTLPMGVLNDPYWTNSWKFRWLSSEQFDYANTVKAIQAHSEYLKQNRYNPSQRMIELLKLGIFYVCGRDAHYRPILVFDVEKMLTANMTEEELIESQKFFFEKILSSYLLPGQVESWVAIIDVGQQNLWSFLGPLSKSIGFLSNTFRCRMKVAYLIKCSPSVSFIWSIVKKFMHKDTIDKINFSKKSELPQLMQYANPSQIQRKYGGSQPDMTQFWPLKQCWEISTDFSHPSVRQNFISQQEYNRLYEQGKLKQHFISTTLLEKKQPVKDQTLNLTKANAQKQQKIFLQNLPEQEEPRILPDLNLPQVMCWESIFMQSQK